MYKKQAVQCTGNELYNVQEMVCTVYNVHVQENLFFIVTSLILEMKASIS